MALFTRILGWSAAEVEVFLVDVKKQVKDRRIHAYFDLSVFTQHLSTFTDRSQDIHGLLESHCRNQWNKGHLFGLLNYTCWPARVIVSRIVKRIEVFVRGMDRKETFL